MPLIDLLVKPVGGDGSSSWGRWSPYTRRNRSPRTRWGLGCSVTELGAQTLRWQPHALGHGGYELLGAHVLRRYGYLRRLLPWPERRRWWWSFLGHGNGCCRGSPWRPCWRVRHVHTPMVQDVRDLPPPSVVHPIITDHFKSWWVLKLLSSESLHSLET